MLIFLFEEKIDEKILSNWNKSHCISSFCSSSLMGISAVDKEMYEYDGLKDSNKFGTVYEFEEIITFIHGKAVINWLECEGLFRGEVNLTWNGKYAGDVTLSGFRRSENGIKYYNEFVVLNEVSSIYVNHFIGTNTRNPIFEFPPIVKAIAIGNID